MRFEPLRLAFLALATVLVGTPAIAAPSSDLVLPDTTVLYFATPDLDSLLSRVEQSQLGRLWNDPRMMAFSDQVRARPNTLWSRVESGAGTTLEQLRKVATGESSAAVVELENNRFAAVFLFTTSGVDSQVQALIARAAVRLERRGAKSSKQTLSGTAVEVFDLPRENGQSKQTVYFVKDGVLGIADRVEVVDRLLTRWPGTENGSLAGSAAFRDVMARCEENASGTPPQLRWFVDPVGLAKWNYGPDPELEGEDDPVRSARRHGFDAVGGIGGRVDFGIRGFDLLMQTSIYAPPPYRNSMRMMSFPSGSRLSPPDWVNQNVSSCFVLSIDVQNAFDRCTALFDDLYADGIQGTFEGVLQDLRAEDGPGVDLGKDLVAYLRNRVILIGQYDTPVSGTSEGNIVAIEAADEKRVAAAVRRLFRDDPGATPLRVKGHQYELWKVGEDDPDYAQEEPGFTSFGVMVAGGHLLIATNFKFIPRLLANSLNKQPLAVTPEFERVEGKFRQLGDTDGRFKAFADLRKDMYTSYELLRLGKGESSESILARLVLGLFSATAEAEEVDFSRLPEFEQVKHHLGHLGMIGKGHPKGWLIQAFVLPPTGKTDAANAGQSR